MHVEEITEALNNKQIDFNAEVEVCITCIEPKKASLVLSKLSQKLPLEDFDLGHLKRIRPVLKENKRKELQLILCPATEWMNYCDDLGQDIGSLEIIKVPKYSPQNREEFIERGKLWPINYRPNQMDREREKGLTETEITYITQNFSKLLQTVENSDLCITENLKDGGIIINPVNEKIIVSSTSFQQFLSSNHGISIFKHPLYTPTFLCIEGVAAVARGDYGDLGYLSEGFYLCTGLDLFVLKEPDLSSAMGLVHSRIRRVFYIYPDKENGALESGRGHIHSLSYLNHHYRVFRCCFIDSPEKSVKIN